MLLILVVLVPCCAIVCHVGSDGQVETCPPRYWTCFGPAPGSGYTLLGCGGCPPLTPVSLCHVCRINLCFKLVFLWTIK